MFRVTVNADSYEYPFDIFFETFSEFFFEKGVFFPVGNSDFRDVHVSLRVFLAVRK